MAYYDFKWKLLYQIFTRMLLAERQKRENIIPLLIWDVAVAHNDWSTRDERYARPLNIIIII